MLRFHRDRGTSARDTPDTDGWSPVDVDDDDDDAEKHGGLGTVVCRFPALFVDA